MNKKIIVLAIALALGLFLVIKEQTKVSQVILTEDETSYDSSKVWI